MGVRHRECVEPGDTIRGWTYDELDAVLGDRNLAVIEVPKPSSTPLAEPTRPKPVSSPRAEATQPHDAAVTSMEAHLLSRGIQPKPRESEARPRTMAESMSALVKSRSRSGLPPRPDAA